MHGRPHNKQAAQHNVRVAVSTTRGVLLLDTLVAITLFSVIIVIVVGALASLIDANQKTRAIRTVVDNGNAALESMGRAIRSGTDYHCGTAIPYDTKIECPDGGPSIFAFEGAGGDPEDPDDQIVFWQDGDRVVRSLASGADPQPITGEDVIVERLSFQTINFEGYADQQPKVLITLVLRAGTGKAKTDTTFTLQTTVAERVRIISVQSSPSGQSANPQNPICPFESAPGRYFINFEVGKSPGSFLNPSAVAPCLSHIRLGPYQPEIDAETGERKIPAGEYKIWLVAFDTHCDTWPNCPPDPFHATQEQERFRLELGDQSPAWFSADYGCDPDSGCSADIPDDQQLTITDIGTHTFATDIAGNVYAWHGYNCIGTSPGGAMGPHSVVPACAVFDSTAHGQSQTSIQVEEF